MKSSGHTKAGLRSPRLSLFVAGGYAGCGANLLEMRGESVSFS